MTEAYSNITISSNINCKPLTMDNLTKQEHHATIKKRKQKSPPASSTSSTRSSRSSSHHCHSRDTTVLQSPRMLSFPYHNDSLFLPTVEQHRPSEKARSMASSIRSGSFHRHGRQYSISTGTSIHSVSSSSIPPSPSTSSSCSKRRRVIHHHRHHQQTCVSPPPPLPLPSSKYQPSSDSCSSHPWIQKVWKVFKKSSWRRQLSFSTRSVTSIIS